MTTVSRDAVCLCVFVCSRTPGSGALWMISRKGSRYLLLYVCECLFLATEPTTGCSSSKTVHCFREQSEFTVRQVCVNVFSPII